MTQITIGGIVSKTATKQPTYKFTVSSTNLKLLQDFKKLTFVSGRIKNYSIKEESAYHDTTEEW